MKKRYTRKTKNLRYRKTNRVKRRRQRTRKQKGGMPTLVSCGSGKCSATGSTVVTYRGTDPVDSVPSFVLAEDAEKMQQDDM